MSAHVLVINSGSSSIKYRLIDPVTGAVAARGLIERIGEPGGRIAHVNGGAETVRETEIADHRAGMALAYEMFTEAGPDLAAAEVVAVGHRIVHGGRRFHAPTVLTDEVIAEIERLSVLAPLHNPPNLVGVAAAREKFPDVPHVAVFDTGFFHDLPEAAATYAIDAELAERHGVRRYGFHGTSHDYVSARAAAVLGRDRAEVNVIVLHLGNGASASAVRGGRAVETSMGMTPLEGLVMGTRGGDIDPGVLMHLERSAGMDVAALDDLLNHRSGLQGMTGGNDFRTLTEKAEAGDEAARRAYEVYVHRLRKYIGAYLAVLGRLDALVFTAGVGENAAGLRADVVAGLEVFGLTVDPARNASAERGERYVSPEGAAPAVLVIPTDEELAIARDAWALL